MENIVDAAYFDTRSQDFIDSPYPFYETLRLNDPVHKSAHGFWVLSRHRDIMNALRDRCFSNEPSRFAVVHQRNRDKYVVADVANNIIPFMDPPQHGRCRKVISRAFRERLAGFELDIAEIALDLLNRHRGAGEIDLINDFGTPLSLTVICRFVGFPDQDSVMLKSWSDSFSTFSTRSRHPRFWSRSMQTWRPSGSMSGISSSTGDVNRTMI